MIEKNPGYGDFGNLNKNYSEARQGFPDKVVAHFWDFAPTSNSIILDVGCGTGISTRQLIKPGVILYGSDKAPEMIKLANEKRSSQIIYLIASANQLPFSNEYVDAVTAFSAFHWFSDKESITEIKRVLKKGGVFFVANKNDTGDFKKDYKALLKPFISGGLPDAKEKYDPVALLKENNFFNIQEKIFETCEFFTLPKAISYLQSISLWNLVPETRKAKATKAIESYCKNQIVEGFIKRELQVRTVVADK